MLALLGFGVAAGLGAGGFLWWFSGWGGAVFSGLDLCCGWVCGIAFVGGFVMVWVLGWLLAWFVGFEWLLVGGFRRDWWVSGFVCLGGWF